MLKEMSVFMEYNLAQAVGDMGAGGGMDGGGWSGADAAGAGLGFGFGMTMPYLIARAYQWPNAWPFGHNYAAGVGQPGPTVAAEPRFCGHCGGGLVPQARFCGHCGLAVRR